MCFTYVKRSGILVVYAMMVDGYVALDSSLCVPLKFHGVGEGDKDGSRVQGSHGHAKKSVEALWRIKGVLFFCQVGSLDLPVPCSEVK
jgi:hypothetical protein